MNEAVYVLCAVTSLACTGLLWRGFLRSRARLLLWSTLCFAALTANNVLLFVDLVVFPEIDMSAFRSAAGIMALAFMLYGLVWEADRHPGTDR